MNSTQYVLQQNLQPKILCVQLKIHVCSFQAKKTAGNEAQPPMKHYACDLKRLMFD